MSKNYYYDVLPFFETSEYRNCVDVRVVDVVEEKPTPKEQCVSKNNGYEQKKFTNLKMPSKTAVKTNGAKQQNKMGLDCSGNYQLNAHVNEYSPFEYNRAKVKAETKEIEQELEM